MALSQVSQGVLIADSQRTLVYVNAAFEDLTGYRAAEAIGRNCKFLQGPETDRGTADEIRRALTNGQTFSGEILNYRKDGTTFWNDLTISPVRDNRGRLVRYIAIQRDVTQRRLAADVARVNSERLQLAAHAGGLGIWEWDCRSEIVTWDARMFLLHGQPPADGEPLPDRWRRTIHPDDLERCRAELAAATAEGTAFDTEFRIIRGDDGCIRFIRSRATLLQDASGRPWRLIGTNWDVTDERERESELAIALQRQKEMTLAAKAGEQAKSQFLAVMSHELRTPMNGILGYAELLSLDPSLSVESRENAQTISRCGSALLRLLDDILEFSDTDTVRVGSIRTPIVLKEMGDTLQVLFATVIEEKHLAFRCSIDPLLPATIIGDAGKIRQILLNLVGNAVKFTHSGSVELQIRRHPAPSGEEVEFRVADTGIGIPESITPHLFEPFTQVDSARSRRFGGTGVGLAICRRLAALLAGRLEMQSCVGKGSTFSLFVPLIATTSDLPPTTESHAPDGTRIEPVLRPSVLAVDDDRVNLKLIVSLLRKLGCDPLVAENGEEAVAAYAAWKPSCVLMDLQMPVVDGFEATRRIRSFELEHKAEPAFIAAVTANTVPEDRQRCFEVGMDFFLNKPLRRQELADVLDRVARRPAGSSLEVNPAS